MSLGFGERAEHAPGPIVAYHDPETKLYVSHEGQYDENGKKTGQWVYYAWKTGIVQMYGEYVDGKKHGRWVETKKRRVNSPKTDISVGPYIHGSTDDTCWLTFRGTTRWVPADTRTGDMILKELQHPGVFPMVAHMGIV